MQWCLWRGLTQSPDTTPKLRRTRAGDGMRKYIIMGVQGSGKGTHAKLLAETLDLEHINQACVLE
jgi:replication-associated recombination protein RarA